MALKITYLGVGSAMFARQLITDILLIDGLETGELALVDIDPDRLRLAHHLVEQLVARSGKRWQISATRERREALPGSTYIINSIEVGGLAHIDHDYEIPLRYGVDQCIGDTIGPGGIFKALRTGPTWLAIVRDAERLCPNAVMLNYTNPMSILTLAALEGTGVRTVGLCHSVQGTSRQLARYLDLPYPELEWRCAGINHNAWFLELRRDGQDLYPRLRALARDPAVYAQDPIRFDLMLHLGAFVTESSGHLSEYVPYYRKRPDLLERYTRGGYLGQSGFYARNWPHWRQEHDDSIRAMLSGQREIPAERSAEYAPVIIEAIECHRPAVIHGNVRNTGLIANLPDGCVEVACLVDRNGVQPTHAGALPEQLAALNRAHMAVHRLVVDALLHHDRQAAKYALMLDPLTAAVLSPTEIDALFEEMWEAQRDALTPFEVG